MREPDCCDEAVSEKEKKKRKRKGSSSRKWFINILYKMLNVVRKDLPPASRCRENQCSAGRAVSGSDLESTLRSHPGYAEDSVNTIRGHRELFEANVGQRIWGLANTWLLPSEPPTPCSVAHHMAPAWKCLALEIASPSALLFFLFGPAHSFLRQTGCCLWGRIKGSGQDNREVES